VVIQYAAVFITDLDIVKYRWMRPS
jgi:hypothetical protein